MSIKLVTEEYEGLETLGRSLTPSEADQNIIDLYEATQERLVFVQEAVVIADNALVVEITDKATIYVAITGGDKSITSVTADGVGTATVILLNKREDDDDITITIGEADPITFVHNTALSYIAYNEVLHVLKTI